MAKQGPVFAPIIAMHLCCYPKGGSRDLPAKPAGRGKLNATPSTASSLNDGGRTTSPRFDVLHSHHVNRTAIRPTLALS